MTARSPTPVRRTAAVLVTQAIGAAAPPGVDSAAFCRALVEDACDLAADLELVSPAIVVGPGAEKALGGPRIEEFTWPGMQVVRLDAAGQDAGTPDAAGQDAGTPDAAGQDAGSPGGGLLTQTLSRLAALGAQQCAVLAADAPDLPPLLVGKLFRALGGAPRRADIAVCPAEGGGLVAVAAWLPLAGWAERALAVAARGLPACRAELDHPDIVGRLRLAAPRRSAVQSAPGWHRLRSPDDLGRLDPGLEGWPATRGLLRLAGP